MLAVNSKRVREGHYIVDTTTIAINIHVSITHSPGRVESPLNKLESIDTILYSRSQSLLTLLTAFFYIFFFKSLFPTSSVTNRNARL